MIVNLFKLSQCPHKRSRGLYTQMEGKVNFNKVPDSDRFIPGISSGTPSSAINQ